MERLKTKITTIKFKYKDSIVFIPLGLYFSEDEHKHFLIISAKNFGVKDFFNFIVTTENPYMYFKNTYYLSNHGETKSTGSRRSVTDMLGLYFTYFPERMSEVEITRFLKCIKYFRFNEKGTDTYHLVLHYCNEPEKVVMLTTKTVDSAFNKSIDRTKSPMSRIPFFNEDSEDYLWLEVDTGWEDVYDYCENFSYAVIDTQENHTDNFTYTELYNYFEEL